MTELFLVPVSDDWIDDFHRTASRPIRIADDAPRELESLEVVRVWGTTEGDGVRKRSTFEAMTTGDRVLFYHHGEFFAAARVAQTFESAELGEWLWGNRESRFIYTLSDFEQVSIPRAALWEVLGYDPSYPLYGFSRVSDQAISTLLERYDSIGEAFQSL